MRGTARHGAWLDCPAELSGSVLGHGVATNGALGVEPFRRNAAHVRHVNDLCGHWRWLDRLARNPGLGIAGGSPAGLSPALCRLFAIVMPRHVGHTSNRRGRSGPRRTTLVPPGRDMDAHGCAGTVRDAQCRVLRLFLFDNLHCRWFRFDYWERGVLGPSRCSNFQLALTPVSLVDLDERRDRMTIQPPSGSICT